MEDKRKHEPKMPERGYKPPMVPPAPQPMPQPMPHPMPWCPMMQYGYPMMAPQMPMMGDMGCGDSMYGGTYSPLYGGAHGYPHGYRMPYAGDMYGPMYGGMYGYPGMGGMNYPAPGMGYAGIEGEE